MKIDYVKLVCFCLLVAFGCTGCDEEPEGECQQVYDCPTGSICVDKECVDLCNREDQCGDGQRCISGLCTGLTEISGCGNGLIEGLEECDDADSDNTNSCTNACLAARCGDGYVQLEEECDLGEDGSGNNLNIDPGSCTSDCRQSVCGDGVIRSEVNPVSGEPYELCDDGPVNSDDWAMDPHCNAACSGSAPYCGDGVVNGEERCDGDDCPIAGDCTAVPAISGKVYLFGQLTDTPQENATVTVVEVDWDADGDGVVTEADAERLTSEATSEEGSYSIYGNVPAGRELTLQLHYPQGNGADNISFQVPSSIVTRQTMSSGAGSDLSADVHVVSFAWLAQTAVDCGIYSDFADATGGNIINTDFITTSAVIGQLRDGAGNPVAGISKSAVSVGLDTGSSSFLNNHVGRVCFLERDTQAGAYRGTSEARSLEDGWFVVFRLVNSETLNIGNGRATVHVRDYENGVQFVSSAIDLKTANIGLLALTTTDSAPDGAETVDFEVDVMPIFEAQGCIGCHTDQVENAPGPNLYRYNETTGERFPAVWSVDANDPDYGTVYANLTGAGRTCGDACDIDVPNDQAVLENNTFPRICVDNIPCSLLLARPSESSGTEIHPLKPFVTDDHPSRLILENWIRQGANRYAMVDFETDVLPIFQRQGCTTSCHQRQQPNTAGTEVQRGGYVAYLFGAANEVFQNITGPGTSCARIDSSNPNFPRVCADEPVRSILFHRMLDDHGSGSGASIPGSGIDWLPDVSTVEPDAITVFKWIVQGASETGSQ